MGELESARARINKARTTSNARMRDTITHSLEFSTLSKMGTTAFQIASSNSSCTGDSTFRDSAKRL